MQTDARDKDASTTMDVGLWLDLADSAGHSIQKQATSKEKEVGGEDEEERETKAEACGH